MFNRNFIAEASKMNVIWLVYVTCVVITFGDFVYGNIFQGCFQKDSISCLQMQLFKAARAFADNSTIEIFSGIGLIKYEGNEGKSLQQKETEAGVENAMDVESRQNALETYLIATGERLWKERTFTWNPAQTTKTLVNTIPDALTSQLTSFVAQARGKKKQMQMLMPILMAIKLKFATLSAIAMMVIAVIAKKAILAAVISLVISGISGIKSLVDIKPQSHSSEVMGYQASDDWMPYTHGGGRFSNYAQGEMLTNHIEPAPQRQVLIGHKSS